MIREIVQIGNPALRQVADLVDVNLIQSDEIQALFFTMLMKNERTRKIARNNKTISAWAVDNHELF